MFDVLSHIIHLIVIAALSLIGVAPSEDERNDGENRAVIVGAVAVSAVGGSACVNAAPRVETIDLPRLMHRRPVGS